MPSSLVVVALVLAWLVVLVPMIVRKRQEVAKTADSELGARVLRSGDDHHSDDHLDDDSDDTSTEGDDSDTVAPEGDHADGSVLDDAPEDAHDVEAEDMTARYYDEADLDYAHNYRPGRGGFDPEAAAIIARAKYAFRQRVVLAMILGAIVSAVVAGVAFPVVWWGHGVLDVVLMSYLVYLRRQVRIETEIRERRLARMRRVRRAHAAAERARAAEQAYLEEYRRAHDPEPRYEHVSPHEDTLEDEYVDEEPYEAYDPERAHGPRERVADGPAAPVVTRSGATYVDPDDEDPAFDELDVPGSRGYRRAVGE